MTFSSALGRLIAPLISASATQIVAQVPDGATTGPVRVTTRAGAALSRSNFLVTGNPLRVRITSPADGAAIPADRMDVAGAIDLSTPTVGVTVNGIPAQVSGNTFIAPNVPLQFAGPTVLTATGVDEVGGRATASITVQGTAQPPPATLTGSPVFGEAPLDVTFSLRLDTPALIRTFEMDFEGDGIVDRTFANQFPPALPFTYAREGTFHPTVTMTDVSGRRFTASAVVGVFSLASLVQQWNDMKAALKRGDIPGALGFIASQSRARYRQVFQVLAADLPNVENILTDIRPMEARPNEVIFEMVRVDGGVEKSFDIRFVRDDDGAWRLRSF